MLRAVFATRKSAPSTPTARGAATGSNAEIARQRGVAPVPGGAVQPEKAALRITVYTTQSATLRKAVAKVLPEGLPFHEVPEAFTSQRVRARLQKEWLPKGLIRLLPTGMRPPPKAYDDYVAALLAEDWLLAQRNVSAADKEV